MKYLVLIILLIGSLLSQSVLVDDAPMCGHHNRETYQALWDSLSRSGADCHFTSIVGRFPELTTYELLILMHHNSCDSSGFSYEQIGQIIDYACGGGNVIIMPIVHDDLEPVNALLGDSRWETGLYYGSSGGSIYTDNISSFSPYTDGVEYLLFEISADIHTSPPAWPFAWDAAGENVVLAISYPESDSMPCDCDEGGRILALPDNHTFEAPVVGYVEPMDHRFMINAMLAMCGLSVDLPPCDLPPDIPYAEIDTCLNPGEIYTMTGENLHIGYDIRIGSQLITPFDAASDSSWISFIVPDVSQGIYRLSIEDSSFHVIAGSLQVFCEWIDLQSLSSGCYDIGDSVFFTGSSLPISHSRMELISSDYRDTTIITDFELESSLSGWFLMPLVDTIYYNYQYFEIINTIDGNRGRTIVQVPCPCPGIGGLFRIVDGNPTPADTRDPIINIDEPDSCFMLSGTGAEIIFSTLQDSFMAQPGMWPYRENRQPINIYMSNDTGFTTIARNIENSGNFDIMPSDTGIYRIAMEAIDDFGNTGFDTVDICIDEYDHPPLTGHIRTWFECVPESILFTVRNRVIVDTLTLALEIDDLRMRYPENMNWLDDTTLCFHPPDSLMSDSSWHNVHMSSMVSTIDGIRMIPDDSGMMTFFRVDRTAPEIKLISPSSDSIYYAIPDSLKFIIKDWLGVDEGSIWVTNITDTFYFPDTFMSYEDTILSINLSSFPISDSIFSFCLGASDIDYPIECIASSDTCIDFSISGFGFVEYLSPTDSFIISCEYQEIRFLISGPYNPNLATLNLNIDGFSTIGYPDSRLSFMGDTLIFSPDTPWPSCDSIFASIFYLEDEYGRIYEGLPANGSFMVDKIAPSFPYYSPIGLVDTIFPEIAISIEDECTGIDLDSLLVSIDGFYNNLENDGFSWDMGILTIDYFTASLELGINDTDIICIQAKDLAKKCGANADTLCFEIYYRELICNLQIDMNLLTNPVCESDTTFLEIAINGGFGETHLEFIPSIVQIGENPGEYFAVLDESTMITAIAQDDSGCTAIDTVFAEIQENPFIEIGDTTVCAGDIFSISIPAEYDSVFWPEIGLISYTLTDTANFESMEYIVEVFSEICSSIDTFVVFTMKCDTIDSFICQLAVEILSDETELCIGDSILLMAELSGSAGNVYIEWTPTDIISNTRDYWATVVPTENVVVSVIAEDDSGCIAIDSIEIISLACDSILSDSECYAHPKPFTPNGDGFNENAILEYPGMDENLGKAFIYTLDNKLLRILDSTNSDDFGRLYWDGYNRNGRCMENGVYLYVIEVDKEVVCHGTLYIMK